jgi:hypothetical protein
MANEAHLRWSDRLAMGLFGLAVGAFPLGLAPFGETPERDCIGTLVIVFAGSGLGWAESAERLDRVLACIELNPSS